MTEESDRNDQNNAKKIRIKIKEGRKTINALTVLLEINLKSFRSLANLDKSY